MAKVHPIGLSPNDKYLSAGLKVLNVRIPEFFGYEDEVRRGEDPEAVHKMIDIPPNTTMPFARRSI
ncbi:MAG: hypothetical protein ACUVXI_11085, partial [bacterium]